MNLNLANAARRAALGAVTSLLVSHVALAQRACPATPMQVIRSAGGVINYLGAEPGIPDLCKVSRSDGVSDAYLGVWESAWPGAGDAYPALRAAIMGPVGTTRSFVTRSVPGLQWNDTISNDGVGPLTIDGITYQTQRISHERTGIEGNTYHSIITSWRDLKTGMTLKTVENQISGQSYGPDTTWVAVKVQPFARLRLLNPRLNSPVACGRCIPGETGRAAAIPEPAAPPRHAGRPSPQSAGRA